MQERLSVLAELQHVFPQDCGHGMQDHCGHLPVSLDSRLTLFVVRRGIRAGVAHLSEK